MNSLLRSPMNEEVKATLTGLHEIIDPNLTDEDLRERLKVISRQRLLNTCRVLPEAFFVASLMMLCR